MPLQLAWLECIGGFPFSMNSILQLVDSLRPDELIWLHAYLTGRVHALMPATRLQVSGRPMGTHPRGPDATEMMNPPLREHALAGQTGQLLEATQEASQKEMPCESAGRCQGATELRSAREYLMKVRAAPPLAPPVTIVRSLGVSEQCT